MLKVGVVGATGYTGIELVRLLLNHTEVEVTVLTSERQAGAAYSTAFPQFQGRIDVTLESFSAEKLKSKADFAFLCLPHHEAMDAAQSLLALSVPVIDLSADFRIKDQITYETWYGPHTQPKLLEQAVYGLPELFRNEIRKAKLVANPGCYPTSCILGLAPLIQNKLIDLDTILCDSKSGVSGAGRTMSSGNMFCEANESLKAYKVGEHRHTPEIEQGLSLLAGQSVQITFVPHLIPMDRGILSTLYAQNSSKQSSAQLHHVYKEFYQKEPFVRIRDLGSFPSTQEVHRTNYCDIGVTVDSRTGRSIVVSAIDNLTKGASGQAVQNMNLMMGFPETTGLF